MVCELYLNKAHRKGYMHYNTTYIQILRRAKHYILYMHILGNMQARVAFKNIEKIVLTHQSQCQPLHSSEHVGEHPSSRRERQTPKFRQQSPLCRERGEGTTLSSTVSLKANSQVNITKCPDFIKGGW